MDQTYPLQYVKGDESVTLCPESSAIFCIVNLPLRLLQSTHLLMTLLVTLLLHINRKPEFLNCLLSETLLPA